MHTKTRTGLILALLLALPSGVASAAGEVEVKQSGGVTYSIRVPEGHAPGKALLVIGLHGQGDEHANFMRFLTSVSSLKDDVLVSPNALKDKAWDNPDLEALAPLIKKLQSQFKPSLVIAFGFSRGAFFACALGVRNPDLVQGIVMHSGGLPFPSVAANEKHKKQAYYVIHGTADTVVPPAKSREAAEALKQGGIERVKLEELPGHKHTIDSAAVERALAWVQSSAEPVVPELTPAEAGQRLEALEKALADEAWGEAAKLFTALAGVTSGQSKIAKLAAKGIKSKHEPLVLAAIAAAGRCGSFGVAPLKKISAKDEAVGEAAAKALGNTGSEQALKPLIKLLKSKSDQVAIAAAQGLGELGEEGGKKAVAELRKALKRAKKREERKAAIQAALDKLGEGG